MIGDIVEHDVSAPPRAPKAGQKPSRFRQWRDGKPPRASAPAPAAQAPLSDEERIHLENVKKLAAMTPEDIEREKQQLLGTLDPKVLSSLLRRAELKEQQDQGYSPSTADANATAGDSVRAESRKSYDAEARPSRPPASTKTVSFDEIVPDAEATKASQPAGQIADEAAPITMHFPPPPEELKQYFPDTPVETSKLAWMQPIADEEEAEYSDQLASVAPSELRFDFRGDLITPRMSRMIDQSAGLHHHGDAPSAAGYTIPELAHLARSSVASQRAMAIQTVGRVLHKLYSGKFNKSTELQYALEKLVKAHRVEETLLEAASDQTRSATVRAHATEALWLVHHATKPSSSAVAQGGADSK